MSEVEEDHISIVIEARQGDTAAFDAIDERLKSMESLVGSLGDTMDSFAKGFAGRLQPAITALNSLADGSQRLSGLKDSLTGIKEGMESLSQVSGMQASVTGANIRNLATSIGTLDGVNAGKLRDLSSGLRDIPGAVRDMGTVDTGRFEGIKSTLDQLADASRKASSVGTGVANLGKGLRDIPEGLGKFGSVSQYSGNLRAFRSVVERLLQTLGLFDKETRADATAIKNLGESIRSLSALGSESGKVTDNLMSAAGELKSFVSDLNAFSTEDNVGAFERLADAVGRVADAYDRLRPAQQAVNSAARGQQDALARAQGQARRQAAGLVGQGIQRAGQLSGRALAAGWGAATKAAQGYASVMQRIAAVPIDAVRARVDALTHSLSRVGSMAASAVFYNALFKALRAGVDGLTTGVQNLYQWALLTGNSFVGTMDSCATSVQYLQNSVGAAASELLDALAPALETVVNYAVAALNAVNQLIAALTGHSTWRRARRAQAQYAEAASDSADATDDANKAVKAYENTVLGFDELNKLNDANDDSSSKSKSPKSGSSVPDYGSMFEEVPLDSWYEDLAGTDDWTALGERIAEGLNSWEKSIDWDRIDKVAATWSKRIWTAFNGFVRKRDWSSFGHTIARGLNVGLHFVDDVAQNARFDELGAGIAGALNRAVEDMDWPALGRVMTDRLKMQLEFLHGFMQGANGNDTYARMNFDALRDRMNQAIDAAFGNIDWQMAVTDVTDGLGQVGLTLVSGADRIAQDFDAEVHRIDWVSWGAQVASYLNQAVATIDWANLGRVLTDGLYVLFQGLHGFVEGFNWQDFGNAIETAITNAFNNIDWSQAGTDVNALANHLLDVIDQAIGAINWEDVNDFITSLNIPQLLWRAIQEAAKGCVDLFLNGMDGFGRTLVVLWLAGKGVKLVSTLAKFFAALGVASGVTSAASGAGSAAGGSLLGGIGGAIGGGVVGLGKKLSEAIGQLLPTGTLATGVLGKALGGLLMGSFGLALTFDGVKQQMSDGLSVGGWAKVTGGAALTGGAIGLALGHPIAGAAIGAVAGSAGQLLTAVVDYFKPTEAKAEELGEDTGQGYADGIDSKKPDVVTSASGLGKSVQDSLADYLDKASQWGSDTSSDLADGLRSGASWVGDQARSLGYGVRDRITGVTDAAGQWGRDVSSDMGGGISALRSVVSGAAQNVSGAISSQLSSIPSWSWGRDASSNFGGGIESLKWKVYNAAIAARNEVSSAIGTLYGDKGIWAWGRDAADNFARGIRSGLDWVKQAASKLAETVSSYLHFSVPDVGPLSDFDTYGPDMMRELADGIDRYSDLVTESVSRVAADVSSQLRLGADDLAGVDARATIANAVTIGVVGSQPVSQGSAREQRPIELVLRVDGEDLARATYNGLDSLASRGVIQMQFT